MCKQAHAHTINKIIATDTSLNKFSKAYQCPQAQGVQGHQQNRNTVKKTANTSPFHCGTSKKSYPVRVAKLSFLQVNKKICKINVSRKKELKGHRS